MTLPLTPNRREQVFGLIAHDVKLKSIRKTTNFGIKLCMMAITKMLVGLHTFRTLSKIGWFIWRIMSLIINFADGTQICIKIGLVLL